MIPNKHKVRDQGEGYSREKLVRTSFLQYLAALCIGLRKLREEGGIGVGVLLCMCDSQLVSDVYKKTVIK